MVKQQVDLFRPTVFQAGFFLWHHAGEHTVVFAGARQPTRPQIPRAGRRHRVAMVTAGETCTAAPPPPPPRRKASASPRRLSRRPSPPGAGFRPATRGGSRLPAHVDHGGDPEARTRPRKQHDPETGPRREHAYDSDNYNVWCGKSARGRERGRPPESPRRVAAPSSARAAPRRRRAPDHALSALRSRMLRLRPPIPSSTTPPWTTRASHARSLTQLASGGGQAGVGSYIRNVELSKHCLRRRGEWMHASSPSSSANSRVGTRGGRRGPVGLGSSRFDPRVAKEA